MIKRTIFSFGLYLFVLLFAGCSNTESYYIDEDCEETDISMARYKRVVISLGNNQYHVRDYRLDGTLMMDASCTRKYPFEIYPLDFDGPVVYYYPDGKSKRVIAKYDNNKPVGVWQYWFNGGKEIVTASFDKKGKMTRIGKVISKQVSKDKDTVATDDVDKESIEQKENVDSNPVKLAQFPGGENAGLKYLSSEVKYPREALARYYPGKIMVSFTITKEGKITDVWAPIYQGFGLDEEAIRVVKNMPSWNPAEKDGKKIASKMSVPIVFYVSVE